MAKTTRKNYFSLFRFNELFLDVGRIFLVSMFLVASSFLAIPWAVFGYLWLPIAYNAIAEYYNVAMDPFLAIFLFIVSCVLWTMSLRIAIERF